MKIALLETDPKLPDSLSGSLGPPRHHCVPLLIGHGIPTPAVVPGQFDLVLLQRALDPGHQGDTSGEGIALDLHQKGVPVVLLTGSLPPRDRAFDLLRRGVILGVISRDLTSLEQLACIHSYRPGARFPNGVASFTLEPKQTAPLTRGTLRRWPLWEKLRDEAVNRGADAPTHEFVLLFRSLISPCAREIHLQEKSSGQSGAAIFRAKVSTGDGPVTEDLAVKYGDRTRIRSEAMHYDRLVGPLPDGVAAQLRWRAETEHLGALAYSWVADPIEDAVPLGPLKMAPSLLTWPRRRTVIDRLFSVSLIRSYQIFRSDAARTTEPVTLLQHYTGDGGLWNQPQNLKDLPVPHRDVAPSPDVSVTQTTWDFGAFGSFPNPQTWARTDNPIGARLLDRLAPCHGDLHVGNVFALPDDSPRLIDFGSTTLGHIYRDFAALETSIRLTCVADTDLKALQAAEDEICKVDDLSFPINYRGLGGTADLREAVRTTMQIRHLARDAVGYYGADYNICDYLFAVVLHMLRYASGAADEIPDSPFDDRSPVRIWHAMYAAAKAAEQAARLNPK